MTVGWTGPFAGLVNWPANQGWSNMSNSWLSRYGDGDFAASVLWREYYGNVNYQVAQSRRLIWDGSFVGKDDDDYNPYPAYKNAGQVWTDIACVYCVTPPIILTPNPRREVNDPPHLWCRIRARMSGGQANNGKVRIYSVPYLDFARRGWSGVGAHTSDIACASTTYPNTPGWNGQSSSELIPEWSRWEYEHAATTAGEPPVPLSAMITHLVVCGLGDGNGNGPYIAAVQVWEEIVAT